MEYQVNNPYGTVSDEAKKSYPNYGYNSLYGPVVSFEKQRFKLDNISLNAWLNL